MLSGDAIKHMIAQRSRGGLMNIHAFPTVSVTLLSALLVAQWTPQQSGTTARLRGVSAASSTVAWASGSGGTYARTTDGGASWQSSVMRGASQLDFRDVQAVDANTAYLLSIGPGEASRIYKPTDGGRGR